MKFLEKVKAGDTDLGIIGFQMAPEALGLDRITLGEDAREGRKRAALREHEELSKAKEEGGGTQGAVAEAGRGEGPWLC